jgi:hydrogenase maturation protein HypF
VTSRNNPGLVRRRLLVLGAVQGVGLRPFVWQLANTLKCTGWVLNNTAGVEIEVQGCQASVELFQSNLIRKPPPLAQIVGVDVQPVPVQLDEPQFIIRQSRSGVAVAAFVAPDFPPCADCLGELNDPASRRFAYPFINCTHCGPRFTIQCAVPYDRRQTTMQSFPLCDHCEAEYHSPGDRRFHAQANACPNCGPAIWLVDPAGENLSLPVRKADGVIELINQVRHAVAAGLIVAIKGIGGFHLACDAMAPAAVLRLRERKRRPFKPLAVMVADVGSVHRIVRASDLAVQYLTSRARPIVLLPKRQECGLADSIAPGNPFLGVMLPYSPLHHLLLQPGDVWIMTSGNVADEPIAFDNADALQRLQPLCDLFLMHDRPIHTVCDDSVVHCTESTVMPIRRSRGYAPLPITLPASRTVASPESPVGCLPDSPQGDLPESPAGGSATDALVIMAVGGEIKTTICLSRGRHAFLSQHIGDMGNRETILALERTVEHLQSLYQVRPQIVVADMHPGYISSQWAARYARETSSRLIQVQHHHAHAAALIAEQQIPVEQPIIACVFDGTGYGTDGAIWGGELLIASAGSFHRAACLRYARLPGGDSCIMTPAKTALAFLNDYGLEWSAGLGCVEHYTQQDRRRLKLQLDRNLNTLATSSMGRMFDVVASLMGVRQEIDYEGQAAAELETMASAWLAEQKTAFHVSPEERGVDPGRLGGGVLRPYPYSWEHKPLSKLPQLNLAPALRWIITDLGQGQSHGEIAARWHKTVSAAVLEQCHALRRRWPLLNTVGLTGGVFQNVVLTWMLREDLEQANFRVLTHSLVPCNDGGLALGQVLIARAMCG